MRSSRIIIQLTVAVGAIISIYSCVEPDASSETNYSEWLSGGSQTIFDKGAGAFSTAFPNLTSARESVHEVGDVAFEQTFVSAPAPINPGLGPIFNNVSCTSCHINDGRGKPPVDGEQISSLLIRVSVPGTDVHGGPNPAPGFGGQLQQRAIFGVSPEALVKITYTEQQYSFADGQTYSLRTPTYTLENPYISLPADLMLSPRIAPPVFGLGLLEAVDETDILALADESDVNDDGISGKPNYTWNIVEGKKTLGRFGWKAANPSILQQSAGAYNEDIGITSFVFPKESSYGQVQYDGRDDEYEVSDSILYAVAFYIRTLAVPARRDADKAAVLQGKQIFTQAKCATCHVPRLRTKVDVAFPEISNQVIFPYTDMLVHDMGTGLADNRPDYDANGQEWRTAPLWGIGLTKVVNGHQNFLHDGRARTLMEAILWHGGEAEQSKEYVRTLSSSDRDALIKFLESL
ncbi:MAG TPA: di-heme oxidoredictase family protein [Ohtaekwangia sp.]|uniref:di-heme oxidoreductase family protein n=1 Tax=Ohtaekwangia sp. TaxID=2066019 RepID=UPI002F948C6A